MGQIGTAMDKQYPYNAAILIVGFRNSEDICGCLTALSRARTDPDFDIFICENGGLQRFMSFVRSWWAGRACTAVTNNLPNSIAASLGRLLDIRCLRLNGRTSRVWIGLARQNLGYAGGINTWIEWLMRIPGWHGAWILNPDTEPSPDALSEAVEHAVTYHKGMVGITLIPYTDRERVYCRAGHRWRKFRTKLGIIGSHEPVNGLVDVQVVEGSLDCVSGACMYVTRLCVEEIGPMDERFFLYYEDADWSFRAKGRGLGYAKNSVVLHKGGTTIGSASRRSNRSQLSAYLESRNRILFVHKHLHSFFLLAYILGVLYALEYLFVGSPQNFMAALMALIAGIKGETGQPSRWRDESKEDSAAPESDESVMPIRVISSRTGPDTES
jgi:GT2 family glycosyltransferase